MSVRSIARTNVFDSCYWTKHLKPSSLHPHLFFFHDCDPFCPTYQTFKHQPGTVSQCSTYLTYWMGEFGV